MPKNGACIPHIPIILVCLFLPGLSHRAGASFGADTAGARLDSLAHDIDKIEQKVLSTLMFGGSSPVSFSGEARVKLQYHNFNVYPEFIRNDRNYLQSGWEGNESLIRLGMVVRPGRNTVLWSKIGFQHTLPGNRYPQGPVTDDGFSQDQTRHDKSLATANIHEDMSAGIAIRTIPVSFWLKMGNIHWTEASPLTVWKAQPRTFAWEFLPFEIEQPIARYYEYNVAKGEKAGRAAWHKKAFNGINLESINLPWNLYANFLYGTFERYDNFEREYVDFSNDLAYAGDGFPVKGSGIGDTYRHVFHARLAGIKVLGGMTPGINFVGLSYRDDIVHAEDANGRLFFKAFGIEDTGTTAGGATLYAGRGFYKEPKVASFDLRGPVGSRFNIHTDIAASRTDTTWLVYDSSVTFAKEHAASAFRPAFFTKLGYDWTVPFQADIAVVSDGFYSPFSFAMPSDGFYAFGSNMVGSGKFMARSEASPYTHNMAGVLLSATPKLPGYGHLRIAYGQHFQLDKSRDVLYFPYRLNGQDFFSVFHSTYNRWGNGQIDHAIANTDMMRNPWWDTDNAYQKRVGDESFHTTAYNNPAGPQSGGLWSDYLATYESFVPYEDSQAVAANMASASSELAHDRTYVDTAGTDDTLTSKTGFVPVHRKYTFNFELDASYDIGPLVGYDKDLFVGGYAAVNGISTALKPLAAGAHGDDMLLWSVYARFEPAIAITRKFYVLGLLGFENWRSEKAWMADSTGAPFRSPIDYRDVACGLGFDWGILDRVGLHFRAKWMRHQDVHCEANNWQTPVLSGEIKMWF
ncbi:MAG: hypothetical protein GF418_07105 [Chitinivibrionales bacterium]|nr:hypothetical protein [Chitinivibrionales bacterium]MBD3395379.1 hypothetical protein [Chitinivibrionales bacterium]